MNVPPTEEAPAAGPSKEALAELKARVRAMLAERRNRPRASAVPPPRYDEVFEAGTAWLDTLSWTDCWPQ